MSSSDDEQPLAARPGAARLIRKSLALDTAFRSTRSPRGSLGGRRRSSAHGVTVPGAAPHPPAGDPRAAAMDAPQGEVPPHQRADSDPAAQCAAEPAVPITQASLDPSTQASQEPGPSSCPSPGGGAAIPAHLPLLLPDRPPTNKFLLELGPVKGRAGNLRATDLSGDSGAIGRLNAVGPKDEPRLQIDLKGVLYDAGVVACPMTLAVLNVGSADARLECLFQECIQMREDPRQTGEVAGTSSLFEDEDGHHAAGGAAPAAGEDPAGGKQPGVGSGSRKNKGLGLALTKQSISKLKPKPRTKPRSTKAKKPKG
ncbi:hypothetical protein ACKKBG_A06785 [Auxenochlorella protothecoides x Auxenochlorella symbiontica]